MEYVYQELTDLPEGFTVPEGRKKPWGTGQAVLACKDVVEEPFVIINADDYYGKEAFVKLHDFLVNGKQEGEVLNMAMAGFVLKNTVSENGAVTRGICTCLLYTSDCLDKTDKTGEMHKKSTWFSVNC